MKFAIGYQLSDPDEESFLDLLEPYREVIGELFFAWPGQASGRSAVGLKGDALASHALPRLQKDLVRAREAGFRLDILFNSNCYGADAKSVELEKEVVSVLTRLETMAGGADVVTTTSPAIAWIVKKRFPRVETRASVNMRIGTVEAMAYLADLFDSFHVQRDFNRDLGRIRELKGWADSHGKRLVMLANSGCLRNCSGQTYHDNLVAHEREAAAVESLEGFLPYTCWNHMAEPANRPAVLQSTWVRPEDLFNYDGLFDLIKLATRLHERPQAVIGAYARRSWKGNLLDLLEPGYSPLFAPKVIDNARFPADWFKKTSECDKQCHRCRYCDTVLKETLVDLTAP